MCGCIGEGMEDTMSNGVKGSSEASRLRCLIYWPGNGCAWGVSDRERSAWSEGEKHK